MKQFSATILGNAPISSEFHELTFAWDPTAGTPAPGCFFTIRVAADTAPLLRRPFAFAGYDPQTGTASMIYQRRGRGTSILAGKAAGERLDILGPLGSFFPLPPQGNRALLVAGGIGLGPVAFLASTLRAQNIDTATVVGCRTASLLPQTEKLPGPDTVICTDDGTRGFNGNVGDYLKSIEPTVGPHTTVYACGPEPMLAACHRFALARGCACHVSVEQVMACGVGACMGCAVKTAAGGYVRACTEGPVFRSSDLHWSGS